MLDDIHALRPGTRSEANSAYSLNPFPNGSHFIGKQLAGAPSSPRFAPGTAPLPVNSTCLQPTGFRVFTLVLSGMTVFCLNKLTRSLHKSSCRSGLLAVNRAGDGAPAGCVKTSPAVNSRINSKHSFHLVEQAAKSAFRPGITQLSG